jgi:hypothetical protein
MKELETELRDLFQAQVDGAERPVSLLPGVRRRARRTLRRRVGATALASVAVIAAAAVPVSLAPGKPVRSPNETLVGGYHKPPRGWVPLIYDNVQIWVPPSWVAETQGQCVRSGLAGVVYGGKAPKPDCARPPNVLRLVDLHIVEPVDVTPSGPSSIAPGTKSINGFAAYIKHTAGHGWSVYVPDLDVRLIAHGPLAVRALETLRGAPRVDYSDGPAVRPLPAGFRWHVFGGIKFAAPASWAVQRQPNWGFCWPGVNENTVVLSSAKVATGIGCLPHSGILALYAYAHLGISVAAGPQTPSTGEDCGTVRGTRWICDYTPAGFNPVYRLYMRPPGQGKPTVIYVGAAGSGAIATKIIDSIHPAPRH